MIATPNGALVREFSPKKILNSGLGITAICPDRWQRVLKRLSVTSKLWGGDDSKPERDLLTCYCYWLLMLLPLRKPWFFVVPLVFGSHWFMDPIRFTIQDQPNVAKYTSPMETMRCAVCVTSRCHPAATVRGHDGIKAIDPTLWRVGHVWILNKQLGICIFGSRIIPFRSI